MIRIVSTMTVIPSREEHVIQAVQSVQSGTVVPDKMYVNIPKKYIRFEKPLDPTLKSKLEAMNVHVNIIEHDRGCLNKILPILEFETDPETLVVTMDDDMIYTPRWLEGLYKGYQQFGGIVGYSGLYYPETVLKRTGQLRYGVVWGHGSTPEMLEYGFGTMFKLEYLHGFPDVPPMNKNSDMCVYLSDDYIMSRFLDTKNVKKTVICWPWVGRYGDDWSSMCQEQKTSQQNALCKSRNSLQDYIDAGKILFPRATTSL